MVNLYIYSTFITLTALLLIWILYKTSEEIKTLKQNYTRQTEYKLSVCKYCGDLYDNQIKLYEEQASRDTDLINQLRKENCKLKNDRW